MIFTLRAAIKFDLSDFSVCSLLRNQIGEQFILHVGVA